MNELDVAIAAWCRSLPDGTSAPPEVLALYERKETLMRELLDLHARFSSGPAAPNGSR